MTGRNDVITVAISGQCIKSVRNVVTVKALMACVSLTLADNDTD